MAMLYYSKGEDCPYACEEGVDQGGPGAIQALGGRIGTTAFEDIALEETVLVEAVLEP